MKKRILPIILILLLSACGRQAKPDVAVIVSLTQTAAAQSTLEGGALIHGKVQGLTPPMPAMVVYAVDAATGQWASVETAAGDATAAFSLQVSPGNYRVFAFSDSGQWGGYASPNGRELASVTVTEGQMVSDIRVSPPSQSPCGAMFGLPASPDGRFAAISGPSEACLTDANAAQNATGEPFDMGSLTRGEAQRVQFTPGTSSAHIESSTARGVCSLFFLGAQAGQSMDVNLTPAGSLSLGAWGVDGTLLLSSLAGESELHVFLPSTQDYVLEVCPRVDAPLAYGLDVYISPLGQESGMIASSRVVYPFIDPFELSEMQMLASYGVPLILPSAFPGDEGNLVPYILSAASNQFDASLDYGADCHGGGACHYGILSGKYVGAQTVPTSTPNAIYDASLAQPISLERGINGYYIPSACGANCSDAMLFFIYEEYQYVLGMKAATQEQMVALVNDAIRNSIP